MKINIDNRYLPSEELGHSNAPYEMLAEQLTLVLGGYQSLFDAGCRDGKMLESVLARNPQVSIRGCDYFQFALDACPFSVKPFVFRYDLRDPFIDVTSHDVVVCTEVAEHIDKDYCNVFLSNLRKCCGKYLVITWSEHGGEDDIINDQHLQHLNPLDLHSYRTLVESHGFKLDSEKTEKLLSLMRNDRRSLSYWMESISVFSAVNP